MAVLNGTNDADELHGTSANDTFNGYDGNDWFYLEGASGSDVFHGGSGTDFLALSGGSVTVVNLYLTAEASVEVLEFDDNYLLGTDGDNYFDLSGVYDVLNVTSIDLKSGNDTFIGSVDRDVIAGSLDYTGKKTIDGGGGGDSLGGGGGDDVIMGGAGDDIIAAYGGNNKLYGGSGNDTIYIDNLKGADEYYGGSGYDKLVIGKSYHFNNLVFSADMSIEKIESYFAIHGTAGNDIFDISMLKAIDIIFIDEGSQFYLDGGNDAFIGSSNADDVDGGAGADTLRGLLGNDRLSGGDGNDVISGGAGNDIIDGGKGADILDGGDGDDIFDIMQVADEDTFLGGAGTDKIDLSAYGGLLHNIQLGVSSSIEIVDTHEIDSLGTRKGDFIDFSGVSKLLTTEAGAKLQAGDDTFIGSLGSDFVNGDSGDDTISGRNGKDVLLGGGGNDMLFGNNDDDSLYGNSGDDQISGGVGIDKISGGSGDDSLSGDGGADHLEGGEGNDAVYGGAGNDELAGGKGNDSLDGGAGNDELDGGDGDDSLDGGAGNDVFLLHGYAGKDTFLGGNGHNSIKLSGSVELHEFSLEDSANIQVFDFNDKRVVGGRQNDIIDFSNVKLINTGKIGVSLREGDDQYQGSFSRDVVNGGYGNDFLSGGLGNDQLTGSVGSDFFIFDSALNAAKNVDVITDFDPIDDTIVLSASMFKGISGSKELSADQFTHNRDGKASDASDRIIYNEKTGNIYYDADGKGGVDGVLFAVVDKYIDLGNADFYIF